MERLADEKILNDLSVRIRAYAASRLRGSLSDRVEDVVQETMMVLYAKRREFAEVPDEELTFLAIGITRRKVFELLRFVGKPMESIEAVGFQPSDHGMSPFDRMLLEEVKAAIPMLGKNCLAILRLKLQGASYDEIARILGKKRNALYQDWNRCSARLRQLLEGNRKGGQR